VTVERRSLGAVPDFLQFARDAGHIGQELLDRIGRYMAFTDPMPFWFDLGITATALAAGDDSEPVWGLKIGASASGKSESLKLVRSLAHQHVDHITEPGLLSVTPEGRRTGLLTLVPTPGLVLINDFSTMLTGDTHSERWMGLLAALRDVYDGRYNRLLGQQERPLTWEGHVTLLGNCTSAIDTHAAYSVALGERWVYLRIPRKTFDEKREAAKAARQHGREGFRSAARVLAAALIAHAVERGNDQLPEWLAVELDDATTITSYGRAAVERDTRSRDITGTTSDEDPMRINRAIQKLARMLYSGFDLEPQDVLYFGRRVAADSMPALRRAVLVGLANTPFSLTMPTLARLINPAYPKTIARALYRAAEELETLGVVRRVADDDALNRNTDGKFAATEWGLVEEFSVPVRRAFSGLRLN
jgi:hypothetical protein